LACQTTERCEAEAGHMRRLLRCVRDMSSDRDGLHARAVFEGCRVFWHLHTPKTAGTAIRSLLEQAGLRVRVSGRHFNFMKHGSKLNATVMASLLQQRWHADLARGIHRPLFVSEEIPLPDVAAHGYPSSLLADTCFFAVIRAPLEWYASAVNHMELLRPAFRFASGMDASGVPAMVARRQGYFDVDNVQSWSAAGGTAAYRKLFLVQLPSLSTFLDAIARVFHLDLQLGHGEPAASRTHGTPSKAPVNAARVAYSPCSDANGSDSSVGPVGHAADRPECSQGTLPWIAAHLPADVALWQRLSHTPSGMGFLSTQGSMACDSQHRR